MRYTLIPRELESAEHRRRDQAHRARMQANSRLASQQRKEKRSRNFWSVLIWTSTLSLVTFLYLT